MHRYEVYGIWPICIVALLLLSSMSLAGSPVAVGNVVREKYFTVTLPPGWKGGATSDPTLWQYISNDGEEQLSISVYVSKTPISEVERPKMLDEFLSARLKSEVKTADSRNLKLSKPQKKQQLDSYIARYSGYDPSRQRRFANLTIVNSKVIVDFYFEALDMSKGKFAKDSRRLFDGVAVPK